MHLCESRPKTTGQVLHHPANSSRYARKPASPYLKCFVTPARVLLKGPTLRQITEWNEKGSTVPEHGFRVKNSFFRLEKPASRALCCLFSFDNSSARERRPVSLRARFHRRERNPPGAVLTTPGLTTQALFSSRKKIPRVRLRVLLPRFVRLTTNRAHRRSSRLGEQLLEKRVKFFPIKAAVASYQ